MKRLLLILTLLTGLGISQPPALAAEAPAPTLEQRVGSLEAYVNNTDPTAPLKDKDGKIAEGLATPTSAVAGPGHNGFMMVCSALVS